MNWRKLKAITPLYGSLLYLIIGGLWVLFSDRVLEMLIVDYHLRLILHTAKGCAFVGITAFLIYGLMVYAIRSLKQSEQALYRSYMELEATHEELLATEEELKQQFQEVQEREAYYRGVYEGISSGILVHDGSGQLIHANESACDLLRINRKDLVLYPQYDEEPLTQYRIDKDIFIGGELLERLAQEESSNPPLLIEVLVKDERPTWLSTHTDHLVRKLTGQKEMITTLVNRTEEKMMEIYGNIINEVDQMVLKGISLVDIEQRICDRFVSHAGFSFVCIGFKEENESVSFRAHAGILDIEHLPTRWDDSDFGQGAVGRAIRLGSPQAISIEGSPYYKAWSKYLKEKNIQSVAAFPLIHEEKVFGAFALYSPLPHFFGPMQMSFFEHFSFQLALLFTQAKAQEKLKENEARYREILEHMSNAVAVYDVTGDGEDFIFKEFNSAAERIEQCSRDKVLGNSIRTLFPYAEKLGLLTVFKRVWQTGESEQLSSSYEENEFQLWRENFIYKLPSGEIVALYRDITHKKQAEKLIWHQAHHDALTGLPNRLLFNEHLQYALAQAKRKKEQCAVLFLDLDRFKFINDTLGHTDGDILLQMVAKRLRQSLREGDIIARQGGDEFLILLSELDQERNAAVVAEKLLHSFSTPFQLEANEVFVSPSIGISIYPTDGDTLETLVKHADAAMYHAKELGRNNYQFFRKELHVKFHQRLALENNLRKGLEQKEFLLHYQPLVNLSSGKVVGVEALIRWQIPERGLVSPGLFIPIAEETGLIVPMGEHVLRSACLQSLAWQRNDAPPCRIAVNISARQFREPYFVETIQKILEETGMDPKCLELEITESAAMDYKDSSLQQLRRLKEYGIRIAIDDFGTGYSSLNSLRMLPIDILKIDQSFVREIGRDRNGEAVLRTIIHLAKDLQLKVIAEGVETQEQFDFLKKEQCDEMQGYLFSKPLPPKEVEKYF
jgi:diguanylate cyclase (GGDEF)-like protein/PAS domain S-box-containing protein